MCRSVRRRGDGLASLNDNERPTSPGSMADCFRLPHPVLHPGLGDDVPEFACIVPQLAAWVVHPVPLHSANVQAFFDAQAGMAQPGQAFP